MSRNIKEIGKELLGKSLNSFHKKTGLTQLEKNNETQDGILNGILSQVDNAYIEKAEQYNLIHLDGYENGTLHVDSTIAPTTTVRHTPKMRSLKTLSEVSNNNVMLTADINDTIIPYMMEVDLMIMEKEVALTSQKNIRKIGAEDMTSMQKRTLQMLERLIKGRTLTEQECQTRVATYLSAGKITDIQAEELMLLIPEVYV